MSAALTLGFAIPFALVLVVLLVVVVLIDRNDEADPQGRRPFAAYAFVIVFLTLFTALFAVTATTNSLMHIVIDDSSSSEALRAPPPQSFSFNGSSESESGNGTISVGPSARPVPSFATGDRGYDDARWRDVVRAGLLAAIAIAVLVFHVGMARRAAEDAGAAGGRARRIYYAYLYATMALAVIVIIGAATAFGYAVFKVLAPGVASTSGVGKRKHAVPDLVTTAVLLVGAGLIFRYHFRRRPTDGPQVAAALPSPPPPPPPPPAPEPEAPAPPLRRPAKRAAVAKKSAPRRPSRTE